MRKRFFLIVFLFAAIGLQQANAQIPDNTNGRLYRLCKTWGYFKYFSQHKCELKWVCFPSGCCHSEHPAIPGRLFYLPPASA